MQSGDVDHRIDGRRGEGAELLSHGGRNQLPSLKVIEFVPRRGLAPKGWRMHLPLLSTLCFFNIMYTRCTRKMTNAVRGKNYMNVIFCRGGPQIKIQILSLEKNETIEEKKKVWKQSNSHMDRRRKATARWDKERNSRIIVIILALNINRSRRVFTFCVLPRSWPHLQAARIPLRLKVARLCTSSLAPNIFAKVSVSARP